MYFSIWIKTKRPTINPINKDDDKCFQYSATVELNYKDIRKRLRQISKFKAFINKYNWKDKIMHQKKMVG